MKRASLLISLILLVASAQPVFAHANLVRSEPPSGLAQKTPPTQVRLWFSEDVEPSFTSVSVLNKTGASVDKGDSQRIPGDSKAMQVSAQPDLPEGLYTVVWKALSAVDGHATTGSFSFTVGDVPLADSSPREVMGLVDAALSASALPPLYEVIVRWLNLSALIALVGAFLFPLLILLPATHIEENQSVVLAYWDFVRRVFSRREVSSPEKMRAALESWSRQWLRFSIYVFILYCLVTLAALAAQSLTAGNGLAAIPRVLTSTRFGMVWAFRVVTLIALGIVLIRARSRQSADLRHNRSLLACTVLGLLLLFSQSLNSHGAAATDPLLVPLLIDFIHLLGTAIWIGGLVQLFVTLPAFLGALPPADQLRRLSTIIGSFSLVVFLTVGVILLSGAYSMLVQVGSIEAFFDTLYGTTLFVKFVLIVPLLALGAFNLIVNRPASAQGLVARAHILFSRINPTGAFSLAVALELVFAIAVLLVVGLLTSVAPARSAYDPSPRAIIETHPVDDLYVTFGIAPGLVGTNDFDVKVQDASASRQPVSNAEVVRLLGAMPTMDMGVQEIAAEPQGDGHYTWRGGLFSMIGPWEVEVLVRRAGRDDARTKFSVLALAQPINQSAQFDFLQSAPTLLGLGFTLLGFAMGTAAVVVFNKRRLRLANLGGAIVVSLIGAFMVNQAASTAATQNALIIPIAPPFARTLRSPIRPDAAQIAAGRKIYEQNCATCHGTTGKGDGAASPNLNPKPADLTIHASLHLEGELFWWVSKGITRTAMVPWESLLTDSERWQAVGYIRTFGQPSVAAAQSPTPVSSALAPPQSAAPSNGVVFGQKPDLKGKFVYTLGDGTLLLLDANGENKRELFTATNDGYADFPAFSPDGKEVAYAASKVPRGGDVLADLRVISVESKAIRTIATPAKPKIIFTSPAFSPDGNTIYFTASDITNQTNPQDEIDRVSAGGGAAQKVIDDARDVNISSDGKKLAFFRFDSKNYTSSLWVASIDGSNAKRVVADGAFVAIATARFSPDSQSLLFTAAVPQKVPGVSFASPHACSLAMILNCFAEPAYAHDGLPWDLWLVNLNSGKFERLTDIGMDNPSVAWSPDGKFIAVFEATGIYAVDREKKLIYKISPNGGYGGFDWR